MKRAKGLFDLIIAFAAVATIASSAVAWLAGWISGSLVLALEVALACSLLANLVLFGYALLRRWRDRSTVAKEARTRRAKFYGDLMEALEAAMAHLTKDRDAGDLAARGVAIEAAERASILGRSADPALMAQIEAWKTQFDAVPKGRKPNPTMVGPHGATADEWQRWEKAHKAALDEAVRSSNAAPS